MDSQNELLMHILAIVAQEESKSIAENVKWSIEKRHSEGKPTGKVPYGYRRIDGNGHWSIEKTGEADRVRLADPAGPTKRRVLSGYPRRIG